MTSPTSLADRTIAALRTTHDGLARVVAGVTPDQLGMVSGASAWSLAQVLSHLGSGAEISAGGFRRALDGSVPADNQTVWDRWNAMAPQEQADGFLTADLALVELLEGLGAEQRDELRIELGFLPAPLPVAGAAGMRLNEAAQHSWDVRVALEPSATLDPEAAEVLVEHLAGDLGFLLGFIGKADQLSETAVVTVAGTDVVLVVADGVSLAGSTGDAEPTASFSGGPEALVRLIGGRLGTAYTPPGLTVTGNVTLDDLRRVFPGY